MFIPLLTAEADEIEIEYEGAGCIASFGVAESFDGNRFVSILCELAPIDGYGENAFEFTFTVSCVSFDGGDLPLLTQDRDIAREYIPDVCRPHIAPSICVALDKLLQFQQPNVIYRVIKFAGLPQKALRKHDMITDMLLSQSYVIDDHGTDEFGRPFYVMVLDQ